MEALVRIESNTREALNNITMDLMNMPVEDMADWDTAREFAIGLDKQMFGMPGRLEEDEKIYRDCYSEFIKTNKKIPEIMDIYEDLLEESYDKHEQLNDLHLLIDIINNDQFIDITNNDQYYLDEMCDESESVDDIEDMIRESLACNDDYCGSYEDYVRAEHYDNNGHDTFDMFSYIVKLANITKLAISKGNLSKGYPLFVEIAGSDQNHIFSEFKKDDTIMVKNDDWQSAVLKNMIKRR